MEDRHRSNDIDFNGIRKRLRTIRKNRGLNVTAAAKLTGMTSGVVSALELNDSRRPGLQSLVTFAKAYNCSLDWIVFGEDAPSTLSSVLGDGGDAGEAVEAGETEVTGEAGEPDDFYIRGFRELMNACDPSEKEYLYRLCLYSHSEMKIIENKLWDRNKG